MELGVCRVCGAKRGVVIHRRDKNRQNNRLSNLNPTIIARGYRVTIPKGLREQVGLRDGSVLEVSGRDNEIIIRVIRT